MHHAEIEHYAALYHEQCLDRYLTFEQFMADPAGWLAAFENYDEDLDSERPLLARQREVAERLEYEAERLTENREALECHLGEDGLVGACTTLEKEIEKLPRRNGHPVEKLRHHRIR